MEHLKKTHFIKRKHSKTPEPKQTRQKVRNSVSRPVSKGCSAFDNMKMVEHDCNRDTPLNCNDIVITSKTMGKYSKTVDDLQCREDIIGDGVVTLTNCNKIVYNISAV